MIIKMYKSMLTGMRSDFIEIAEFLSKSQVLQVSKFHDSEMLELTNVFAFTSFEEMISLRSKLEELQNKITSLQVNLPVVEVKEIEEKQLPTDKEELLEYCEQKLNEIEPEFKRLQQRSDYLNQKLSLVQRYRSYITKIRSLVLELAEHHHYGAEGAEFVFVDRYENDIEKIVDDLEKLTNRRADVFTRKLDNKITAVIVLAPNIDEVIAYFDEKQVTTITKPEEFESSDVTKICYDIQDLVDAVEEELIEVRQKIENLAKNNTALLRTMNKELDKKVKELGLADNVKLTEYTFTVTGYVPKTKLERFKDELNEKFSDKVDIIVEPADIRDKDTPVIRKTSNLVKPFTVFTDLLSKPSYGSLDPVTIVAFLWPFYWGFMVGDVGYGLLAITVGTILKIKLSDNETFQKLGNAFTYAGVFTVLFGIIYGEFFGDFPVRFGIISHEQIIFDRYVLIAEYLVLSFIVAFICIFFAVILGGINGIKLNHPTEIKMSLTSTVYLSAIAAIVIAMVFFKFDLTIIGVSILAIVGCLAYFFILENVRGIIHAIEILTNMMSFARLMAIGLVGVLLANIANIFMLGQVDAHDAHHVTQVLDPIIGIPLGIGIHILNFAIIILSPSIQALRLNLVETMNQYYEGGGKEYQPFGEDLTSTESINV